MGAAGTMTAALGLALAIDGARTEAGADENGS